MDFTSEETKILKNALASHKSEVKKIMTKAEKLGLKAADDLKRIFVSIDVLSAKISGN